MSALTVTERYRTKHKAARVDPPPSPMRMGPILPMRVIHARQKARLEAEQQALIHQQRAEMEREGVGRGSQFDVTNRRVDEPFRGQMAVLPKDEREAKYGKPLMYADVGAGKTPLVIMGNGAEHWQYLRELADETRHYGLDKPEHPQTRRHSYEELWQTGVEIHRRKKQGLKTYGAQTRGTF